MKNKSSDKNPIVMCFKLGNSITVPIHHSIAVNLGIDVDNTAFEQEITKDGIFLRIKKFGTVGNSYSKIRGNGENQRLSDIKSSQYSESKGWWAQDQSTAIHNKASSQVCNDEYQ